jgi:hypothetical protein
MAANPNPKAPVSTKPGEPAGKVKPPKVVRIPHPSIKAGPDGKGTVKLDEFPADWNPKIHIPMHLTDFSNEAVLYEKYVADLRARADKFAAKAEICRKTGSAAKRKKLEKIARLKDLMSKLEKEVDDEDNGGGAGAVAAATVPAGTEASA